ncbi:MmgE/PrpD family protein [Krasilnikovia sp. M28-CT-15]|uniref:MmgE/PrpD family protein n=1 Tax=Krasilnikovia sp. M28-CT-15 TaxID=3373540 RepID=UPI0038769014
MSSAPEVAAVFHAAVGAGYSDLPTVVREDCKRSLLDVLACCAAASPDDIWDVTTTDPVTSTLNNALRAHAGDFDPVHPRSHGHPAAMLFPALLPYFASGRCSGADLVTAYGVGHEAMCVFGDVAGRALRNARRHPTCLLGAIGVAVGVGRILGLPAERMGAAAFLAATATGGHAASFGSAAKAFQLAVAARNGHSAAIAVADGILDVAGSARLLRDVLDGTPGCLDVRETAAFGEPWRVESVATFHKPLAICGYLITTVLGFANRLRGRVPSGVESVHARVPWTVAAICRPGVPDTVDEARFALAFLLSVCLVHPVDGFESRFASLRRSAEITRLTSAATVSHDPDCDDDGLVRIELHLRNAGPMRLRIPVGGDAEMLDGDRVVAAKWERHAASRLAGLAEATADLETMHGPDWWEILSGGAGR